MHHHILNCLYIWFLLFSNHSNVIYCFSLPLLLLGCCCIYDDASSKHEGIQCLCLIYPFGEGTSDDSRACCPCVFDNDVKGCVKYLTKFIALYETCIAFYCNIKFQCLGGFLLPANIFCNINGNTYTGCSSS